jgi:transcription elongation GreA/GreB family factor
MNKTIKLLLYNQCLLFIEQRVANSLLAMQTATDSGNDETKSSAGDKHETGRAMAQLEQEKTAKQLQECLELKATLLKIDPQQQSTSVLLGSIVYTNNGIFYISIPAGKLQIDTTSYYAISAVSPVALKLKGLSAGNTAEFNGQKYTIEKVE